MLAHIGHVIGIVCAVIGVVGILFVAALWAMDRAAARGWNPFE